MDLHGHVDHRSDRKAARSSSVNSSDSSHAAKWPPLSASEEKRFLTDHGLTVVEVDRPTVRHVAAMASPTRWMPSPPPVPCYRVVLLHAEDT
jgi:hypothetical protein